MSDLLKIIITACLTALGGVVVSVFGQWVVKLIIDPIQEQAKLIGEIKSALYFSANKGVGLVGYYTDQYNAVCAIENPKPSDELAKQRYKDLIETQYTNADFASTEYRRYAGRLLGTTLTLRGYGFWEKRGVVRSRSQIEAAVAKLTQLSNSIHSASTDSRRGRDNAEAIEVIEQSLFLSPKEIANRQKTAEQKAT